MMDWGSKGIGGFTATLFEHVHPAIDPSVIKVPRKPFVVCVVGATRDIGKGIATSYAQAGATGIVLSARSTAVLGDVAAACKSLNPGIEIETVACDISDFSSVAALAGRTKVQFGRVDAVIINSAFSGVCKTNILDVEPDSYMEAASVNYLGTFHMAKHFVPLLLESTDGAKEFHVVSSIAALIVRGPIANAQYCVSKMAQLKLMEHIHDEFQGQGLKAFSIHPGAVDTKMARDNSPTEFLPYLTDSPELCGGFCVWLSAGGADRAWLSGRLLSAKWDTDELESRKDEIVSKELLKTRLRLE